MLYVISCGDEGVQINEGTRLGLVGAGVRFPFAEDVITAIKKTFSDSSPNSSTTIALAASEENDWIRKQFSLSTWEQTSATMQQQVEALADSSKLAYAGVLPFADPQELLSGVKGHMVRPRGIHIGNMISLTLAGGEQTYHLGHYVISADWVSAADPELVRSAIQAQIEFYSELSKSETPLPLVFEMNGVLGEAAALKNREILEKLGFQSKS